MIDEFVILVFPAAPFAVRGARGARRPQGRMGGDHRAAHGRTHVRQSDQRGVRVGSAHGGQGQAGQRRPVVGVV